MNGEDREYFESRFKHMEKKQDTMHDDILVLKTKWNLTTKVMGVVSGFVALTTALLVEIFWR